MSDQRRGEGRGGRPSSLGGLLGSILAAHGMPDLVSRAKLQAVWSEVAGEPLRRFSRAVKLENGELLDAVALKLCAEVCDNLKDLMVGRTEFPPPP